MPISHAELKKLRSLQTDKGRQRAGVFVAEGVRLLEEALRFEHWPAALYYTPSLISDRGRRLVDTFKARELRIREISAVNMRRVSGVTAPQGILGVFAMPDVRLSELYTPEHRNILLCENISDPGNVGTLCRSALAFSFDLIVLTGSCADPFSPKVVRASMGAVFELPIAVAPPPEIEALAERENISVIATSPRGGDTLDQALAQIERAPLMLAVGSEADGLSENLLARAHYRVRIPHSPRAESLNSAVAGSIVMMECFERRIRSPK